MESKSLSSNESDRDLGGSSDHSGDEFNTEIAALREKLSKAKQEKMEPRNGVVSLFQQVRLPGRQLHRRLSCEKSRFSVKSAYD